jgi:tetratricopeptide (TPR) repeat protein
MKRFSSIFLALLIVVVSLTIVSCDKSGKEYNKAITEADGLFKEDNYSGALKLYKKAAGIKPEESYPVQKINEIGEIQRQIAEQEAEDNYYREIEQADNYFDEANYEFALASYTRALSYKPGEQYPLERIAEIELLMPLEEEIIGINESLTYHIIVGSYEIEDNALKMQQKLQKEGFDGRLVKRYDGEFTAVILSSYDNIHDAYNNLTDAKAYAEHPWVIYKRF